MKSIKKLVAGFAKNRKIALINLETARVAGWVHPGCARKLIEQTLAYSDVWQAMPITNLADEDWLKVQPCAICCKHNFYDVVGAT